MNAGQALSTLVCVAMISIGQILFKLTAASLDAKLKPLQMLRQVVVSPWFVSAGILYVAATLLWVWILRSVPLGLAYPFMGLAFVFVPALASLFLGEPLQVKVILAGALIAAGIYLAGR